MKLILYLFLVIPQSLLKGWVLHLLWGWYIKPMFDYDLGIIQAIGISLIINLTTLHSINRKTDTDNEIFGIIFGFIYPIFILLFGWFWSVI